MKSGSDLVGFDRAPLNSDTDSIENDRIYRSDHLTWVDHVHEYFVQLLLLIFLNQSSMNRNLFNKIRFIIN
jgi:hypothetical protein